MIDMLVDIFERNSKLTKFLRDNAPRDDMPEKMLKDHYESVTGCSFDEEVFEPWIELHLKIENGIKELNMMRNALALYAEVAEYVDEMPFKWWGRGAWEMQCGKAAEELVDILHFLMIAFEDLDYSPKEIHKMYVEKNKVNWERFKKKLGWKEPQR